jgi:hypothetical protein
MKIQLIKEREVGKDEWYEVRVDGKFVYGSFNFDKASDIYNSVKHGAHLKSQEVLCSEEI